MSQPPVNKPPQTGSALTSGQVMMIVGAVLFLVGTGLVAWQLIQTFGWIYADAESPEKLVDRYEQEQDQAPSLSMLWIVIPGILCSAAGGVLFKMGLLRHEDVRASRFLPQPGAGKGKNPTVTHTFGQEAHGSCANQGPGEKFCSACDRSYPSEAMFCITCGRPLDSAPR